MPRRSVKSAEPQAIGSAAGPAARPLALNDMLDLTAAADLAGKLLALRGLPITIDASGVRHIGAQCGQVLISAAKTWDSDGIPLSLIDPSAEFAEGLRLLGLASALASKEIPHEQNGSHGR